MRGLRGRVHPLLLCAAAFGWGVAVVSAGFWFPFYEQSVEKACAPQASAECTSGVAGTGTATLVDVNGADVLYVLAIPAIASLLVGALVVLASGGSRLARRLAWAVVGPLGLVTLLSGFSVGLWFVPSVLLLVAAVASVHPSVASPQASAAPGPA